MKKHLANIVTLLNLASGLISIYFSINKDFFNSSIFILLAMVFDFLDGRVARIFRVESDMGAELDSLSDLVSFGVAPAILIYIQFQELILAYLLILFVLAGAFRLARFNVLRKKVSGFMGMPITVNGFIFPILYFASATIDIIYPVVILSTIMMASTLRFKKL